MLTGDDWGGDHYGYLWWVHGCSAPYNSTYSAVGNDGQYITLFQEHGAVLACTSDSYDAADDLTELVENHFLGGDSARRRLDAEADAAPDNEPAADPIVEVSARIQISSAELPHLVGASFGARFGRP